MTMKSKEMLKNTQMDASSLQLVTDKYFQAENSLI